jgi:hypothetical protein
MRSGTREVDGSIFGAVDEMDLSGSTMLIGWERAGGRPMTRR